MFGFFREKIAQRAVNKVYEEILDEGLPSAFGKDASAGYLASLALAKPLYMHMYFGENRFLKDSDAGRPDRDKALFATLVTVMFSAFAPFMGIDKEQVANVVGWQFRSIPEVWHTHLMGLTEALMDEAGDSAFQSNSILALMKEISNASPKSDDALGFISGMEFQVVYLAYLADWQKQFKRIRAMLDS